MTFFCYLPGSEVGKVDAQRKEEGVVLPSTGSLRRERNLCEVSTHSTDGNDRSRWHYIDIRMQTCMRTDI